MSAIPLTLEQKEKNQQYILTNLDKYTIDANGDFFNVDPEILGEEYDYI
ncbi:9378_t:CDS:1, partial [Cetraspora pellucida]